VIIVIGGEKGGSGKTTLATNIAVMRARRGGKVLLVDTDRQSSALDWVKLRRELKRSPELKCVQVFGKGTAAELTNLGKRYGDIVVDVGGRDSVEFRAALTVADKLFVPTQVGQFDVWVLETVDQTVETAIKLNPELQPYVFVNRALSNPRVSEAAEAQQYLSDLKHLKLARTILHERIIYRKAATEGLAVVEFKPLDIRASQELWSFYKEVGE